MKRFALICTLFCALFVPASAQLSMTGVGGGFGASGGGGGCTEATTLNAKLDGSQNSSAVTTAVCGMVTDGTWAKLDWLYVFAINSSGNALLNWKSTSFNGTVVGANCTFNANAGYVGIGGGAGNCHINTGYTPSTAGGNATLNSSTAGTCVETSSTGNSGAQISAYDGSNTTNLIAAFGGGGASTFTDINDTSFTSTYSPTNAQGSWILSRTGASTVTYYLNGSSVATPNPTSSALVSVPLWVLARNNNSTEDLQSSNAITIGYAFYASGMTGTEVSNIRSRLQTYMTAVGASGC